MAGATRDRIITEATRLFAAQGIRGTTVAQIEQAVGLRKGSGGVHRYFASKDDLVRAVLETQLAAGERTRDVAKDWARPSPEQVPAHLDALGHFILTHADDSREVALIMLRDAHNMPPGLLDEHHAKNFELAYTSTADAIRAGQQAAGVNDLDADAIAFLFMGPLIYYRLIEWATGWHILGLDDDRLIKAWVEIFEPVFTALAANAPA